MTTKEDLPKDDGFIHIEDDQLVAEVMNVFKWNIKVPEGKVKVTVKEGWVTLEGNLQWDYQKKAAKDDIIKLIGVKGGHK
jgi:osmotically-inducible protein OsmY